MSKNIAEAVAVDLAEHLADVKDDGSTDPHYVLEDGTRHNVLGTSSPKSSAIAGYTFVVYADGAKRLRVTVTEWL